MRNTSEPTDFDNTGQSADEKPAIVINDIRKTFKIKHTGSFKETFVAWLQRKATSSAFNAIDGLSMEVPRGQSIALLGKNGSGKSTTLKMLSGVMRPDNGWIRTRGRIAGLLEVGAGFNPNLTGRDNVYLNAAILGMSKAETDARFQDILDFSEIGDFIDTEVKYYSSGMYSRLGFSVAVHTEVDILLVDEILSVGDAAFREKCNKKMLELREQGKTLFVVSHNAGQVKRLCERGIVLEKGNVIFDGPIKEAVSVLQGSQSAQFAHPVTGPIRDIYDRNPAAYGKPLDAEERIEKNGGGTSQQFEGGIIAFSDTAEQGFAVPKGIFLTAYLREGGPSGSWGFPAGVASGNLSKLETRSMPFQHGIVEMSAEHGLRFRAHS